MELEDFEFIEKEEIPKLSFPADEILKKDEQITSRRHALNRAIALGNMEHQKVKIFFEDEKGKKYVDTTIWAVTEDAIVLKKNSVIPIHRIVKLEI